MNRKQKRAQAASERLQSADDIPLSQPDRTPASSRTNTQTKTKTLYEIAAEKQAELLPQLERRTGTSSTSSPTTTPLDPSNVINVRIGPNGEIIQQSPSSTNDDNDITGQQQQQQQKQDEDDDTIPPVLDTLIFALSLSAIHFTLETLTVHQYAQALVFGPIIRHTLLVALPALFLLIHLFHGHVFHPRNLLPSSSAWRKFLSFTLQAFYVVVANWAGCTLIRLTNRDGYYAVMKNAPSIGTVWVWTVIESGLLGALAGVLGPALYAWWNGYGF